MTPVNLKLSANAIENGEQAILQDIALQLYSLNIFTFSQARQLANCSVWEFQQLLGKAHLARHYDETDLAEDLESIETGAWVS